MALYVYAVVDGEPDVDGLSGVHGAAVDSVQHEGLAGVVSEVDPDLSRLTEDDLWSHETVVEELMDSGPVLPMRFGTTVPAGSRLAELLHEHRAELRDGLARVAGRVEVGVRAAFDAEAEPSASPGSPSGAEYLLARLERQRRIDMTVRQIHEPLAALARDSSFRVAGKGADQLEASYLLDRSRLDDFQQRVEQLEHDSAVRALACTGPWPPYSFAGVRLGE